MAATSSTAEDLTNDLNNEGIKILDTDGIIADLDLTEPAGGDFISIREEDLKDLKENFDNLLMALENATLDDVKNYIEGTSEVMNPIVQPLLTSALILDGRTSINMQPYIAWSFHLMAHKFLFKTPVIDDTFYNFALITMYKYGIPSGYHKNNWTQFKYNRIEANTIGGLNQIPAINGFSPKTAETKLSECIWYKDDDKEKKMSFFQSFLDALLDTVPVAKKDLEKVFKKSCCTMFTYFTEKDHVSRTRSMAVKGISNDSGRGSSLIESTISKFDCEVNCMGSNLAEQERDIYSLRGPSLSTALKGVAARVAARNSVDEIRNSADFNALPTGAKFPFKIDKSGGRDSYAIPTIEELHEYVRFENNMIKVFGRNITPRYTYVPKHCFIAPPTKAYFELLSGSFSGDIEANVTLWNNTTGTLVLGGQGYKNKATELLTMKQFITRTCWTPEKITNMIELPVPELRKTSFSLFLWPKQLGYYTGDAKIKYFLLPSAGARSGRDNLAFFTFTPIVTTYEGQMAAGEMIKRMMKKENLSEAERIDKRIEMNKTKEHTVRRIQLDGMQRKEDEITVSNKSLEGGHSLFIYKVGSDNFRIRQDGKKERRELAKNAKTLTRTKDPVERDYLVHVINLNMNIPGEGKLSIGQQGGVIQKALKKHIGALIVNARKNEARRPGRKSKGAKRTLPTKPPGFQASSGSGKSDKKKKTKKDQGAPTPTGASNFVGSRTNPNAPAMGSSYSIISRGYGSGREGAIPPLTLRREGQTDNEWEEWEREMQARLDEQRRARGYPTYQYYMGTDTRRETPEEDIDVDNDEGQATGGEDGSAEAEMTVVTAEPL